MKGQGNEGGEEGKGRGTVWEGRTHTHSRLAPHTASCPSPSPLLLPALVVQKALILLISASLSAPVVSFQHAFINLILQPLQLILFLILNRPSFSSIYIKSK